MISPAITAVERLTRREREVLLLLAQGRSAPEIAQGLTLALSTVKFHLDNLYGKLGANTKRQALDRARELGLLAGDTAAAPAPKHNLPLQNTRFFGREAELAHIRARLEETRLVTLTGLGGVGKTRLALRAADELLPDYPEGIWFVELAALSDPSLVPQQVAATLDLRDVPGRPVLENLTHFLRQRQTLILLDNCEHLLEGCARLCDTLLRACPGLRLLVCSREPLGVAGEVIFIVPSLPFPEAGQPLPPKRVEDYAAVRLFTDRARLVRPDYQVAAHNAASVAGICRRVDGIPLAIEMAAARLNTLSADQLASRLDDAFRLLTSGSRAALPRQQTLRATIDWSYHLLAEAERLLLQRLSIFAGGCTLEAAEAVCSGDDLPTGEVLDHLAALVAKSLVVAERQPGAETRYRLLEMVRQYAREKLQDAADAERLSQRHRDYFLAFAETTNEKLETKERPLWEQIRAADRDNLRQALVWSFSDPADVEAGPRLLFAMCMVLSTWQEGFDWFKRCVAWCQSQPGIPLRLYAKVLACASVLASLNNLDTGIAWAKQAVEISRGLGADGSDSLVESLGSLAGRYLEHGDFEPAAEAFGEMEALLLSRGEAALEVNTRMSLYCFKACLACDQGQYQVAKEFAEAAIRLQPSDEDCLPHGPVGIIGEAHLNLGEYVQARNVFLELLRLGASLTGDNADNAQAHSLRWLADVDIRQGNLERALEYCLASLRQANNIPDYNIIASDLGLAATIAAQQGQPQRAATLSGASQIMYVRQQRRPWEDSTLDTLLPGWQARPDHAAIAAAFAAGQAFTNDQAIAYALSDANA